MVCQVTFVLKHCSWKSRLKINYCWKLHFPCRPCSFLFQILLPTTTQNPAHMMWKLLTLYSGGKASWCWHMININYQFHLDLPIVQLVFEGSNYLRLGTIWGWGLFEAGDNLRLGTIWGWGQFEGGFYSVHSTTCSANVIKCWSQKVFLHSAFSWGVASLLEGCTFGPIVCKMQERKCYIWSSISAER